MDTKHICCILLLLGCVLRLGAQSYNVPSSGTQTITTCGGHVLDPGGTSTYSNSCDGYLVVNPATPGCKVKLTGSFNTENNFDYFYVYDGTSASGTQLGYFTGTGTCDVTSNSGPLTIYFHSDPSVVRDGFDLDVTCVGSCTCGGPYGITTSTGNGVASISWTNPNSPEIGGFILEYGLHGFTPGTGTLIYTTGTSYSLTGLTNGTQYDIYVWFDCGGDHVVTTEVPTMVSVTPSTTVILPANGSTTLVACNGHIYDSGGPSGQYTNSESGSVTIYAENPWCQLHLTGTYNTENCCDHIYIYDGDGISTLLGQYQGSGSVDLTSTGSSMTINFTSDGSVLYDGFDFVVSCTGTCQCGALPLSGVHVIPDGFGYTLVWNPASADTSIHQYIIEYGLEGFTPGTGTVVTVTSASFNLTGLTPGATYTYYIWADCNNDGVVTNEVAAVCNFCMPTSYTCLDFTDLTIPQITCTTGKTNVNGPYTTVGVVDFGPASASSQHTIHYTSELDPRTGNHLSTIPPCEIYSVRLGNWNTSYGCESISYNFTVDTTETDIILLKYAAVLQNPSGHSANEQPRFTFEILDQNNNQIDPTCGYANFVSGSTTDGWNQTTYSGSTLYWKDWTSVGFDVSAYHGQTVKVRLTTYDCDQGAHFGYAYFTLNCNRKVITAESCGELDTVTYSAPTGFHYDWYYQSAPNNILSHSQSITISPNGQNDVLCCHVSFSENASCGFNLYTAITSRYPLASFAPAQVGCTSSYTMNNTSCVSADGVNPLPTMEACETARWDFGDGTTSNDYSPTHEFPGPGTYTVTLISGLSNEACTDTSTYTVHIENNFATISGNFDVCQGGNTTLYASGGTSYQWFANGALVGSDSVLTVSPATSTTYTLLAVTDNGCEATQTQLVTVSPAINVPINDTVCLGAPYQLHGFNLPPQTTAGVFNHTCVVSSPNSCDTTMLLTLTVRDSLAVEFPDVTHIICYGASTGAATVTVTGGLAPVTYHWANAAGGNVSNTASIQNCPAGTYALTVTDHLGCSATASVTLNTLNGEMIAGSIADDQVVCEEAAVEEFTGTAASGGDNGSYQWQVSTDGTNWANAPGTSNDQNYTYPNPATGNITVRRAWVSETCGTVYSNTVEVLVWHNSTHTITDGVCLNHPYHQNGFNISADETAEVGEYTFEAHYGVAGGCDSTVILQLTVYPDYESTVVDEACEGAGYNLHGLMVPGSEMVNVDTLSKTFHLQSVHGCDSVVHLHLTLTDTALRIVQLTPDFCDELIAELMVVTPMPDYVWSTGESTPTITVTSPGLYAVTALDGDCENTVRYRIEDCHYDLRLPNAITPSVGDGINDCLYIPEINQRDIALFEISIINRWDELVFFSTDKNFKWYGDFKGQTLRGTVYNYIIKYTDTAGRPHRVLGSITVL